ncbi:uncharacterized protein LOC141725154 [Apium graveolens]|uniref:uncharacterized protein LOC141725154 n=1 Tax=Apium graveolens TaxID=4045 RepID=UPI003D7A3E31
MARRRSVDDVQNGKMKEAEEIDTHRTVYIDTNLDTHLALVASVFDTVVDIKKKVMLEHLNCFPKLGEISIHALKVKRKGHFYHLSDSMRVNRVFEGVKNSWFLSLDASCMKQPSENGQSCRPNISNRSPMLFLPYNPTNTGCKSSILKSASVQCPSNQKVEPILDDSCREYSEDIVKKHKFCSSEILKNVSADHNRVSDFPTAGTVAAYIQCNNSAEPSPEIGLSVKKKKQKIKKHNVDELGDSPVKENISLEHVSGRDELCHEILLSAVEKTKAEEGDALQGNSGLVCKSTQKTSKQESILPEFQHTGGNIASNNVSYESTDTDHLPMSLHIENKMSKKKRKRHDVTLSGADNYERASCPSAVKDSAIKDRVKEKNNSLSHVTRDLERKTSKQETIFPEDKYNNQIIASNIMSSQSTETDQVTMSLGVENMKSKKKRKMHELNLSNAENHDKPGLPLPVKDSSVEDKMKVKNIPSHQETGQVLSTHKMLDPSNLLLDTERKDHKEIDDSPKETTDPVSTSKQVFELAMNSEGQNYSPKVVLNSLSSEPADNQQLRTSPAIKSKRGKKKRKKDIKRKKDVTFNLPSAVVLPSSVLDAGGEESFQEKSISSNDVAAGDESHHEVTVPINMVVNAEKTEHEENSEDPSKENKGLVSINGTSTQETGLASTSMADKHNNQKVAVDNLSSAAADNEHLRTGTDKKSKTDKKKMKTNVKINISNSTVLPSSARDAGAESLNEKKRASNYVSAGDETHPESAVPAKLLVDREKIEYENIGNSSKEDKNSVSSNKTSARGTGLTGNNVEDQSIVDSFPEPAESEHLRSNSSIKRKKSKKKSKKETAFSLSSAVVLPSSAQDVGEESYKEKKVTLNDVSGEDESLPKVVVTANLLVNSARTEHGESSGDHFEQNKGSVSQCKNISTQDSGLKENSVQDQDNTQKVVLDTLYPELADSEHLGTNSNIKKVKKKKKRKIDATLTVPSANVLPSFVQDAVGEESLNENIVSLHEDESHHEIVIPENFLVNAERPEGEEIPGDPMEKDKVGFNAASTTIGLNLDKNTAQISMNEDLVNIQSADMIKDKSRNDQANFNIQSQPAVSESGSDRIDFMHYFLPGKAKDKVAASDKNGITRLERDDITKKIPNKNTASLTSHDQAPPLQSSKNQEGGVKSHIKCSSDIDPQESFSQDVSGRSLRPSKNSSSNKYQKGLASSFEPDQARTPRPVLQASGRGVSANSTPASAYTKGKKVSSAVLSSNSESFGKSPGTKSKKLVSNADRRLVACAKGSAKGISEVKSRPLHKKSLLNTPGFIFKDDSSESSDDEGASERSHARTPSDDVSSSDSDRETQISLDSLKRASGSCGLDKKEDVLNIEKKRSSNLRTTTIDMILRSSSRYKKAKLTAESQPEMEDSESQLVDCVPDSQANP